MSTSTTIQLVRNATLLINYAGKKILVDPMFSSKGAFESFAGIANNPIVDLPMSIEEIVKDVDLTLVTHTHLDHLDPKALDFLDTKGKIYIQPEDLSFFESIGFDDVEIIPCTENWDGITICRTVGQHGSGEVLKKMGRTSGFVLQHTDSPTIYLVGDSIFTLEVMMTIERFNPDIIVVNSGGAKIPGYEQNPILMDENETMKLIGISGNATIVAVHMDAIDHCFTTREILRKKADESGISKQKLLIPFDSEMIQF